MEILGQITAARVAAATLSGYAPKSVHEAWLKITVHQRDRQTERPAYCCILLQIQQFFFGGI